MPVLAEIFRYQNFDDCRLKRYTSVQLALQLFVENFNGKIVA